MASGGYFLTAMGRDGTGIDGSGGYILVGTKPQGSAVARWTSVVRTNDIYTAVTQLFSGGYAVVGYVYDAQSDASDAGHWLLIGER